MPTVIQKQFAVKQNAPDKHTAKPTRRQSLNPSIAALERQKQRQGPRQCSHGALERTTSNLGGVVVAAADVLGGLNLGNSTETEITKVPNLSRSVSKWKCL